MRPLGLPQVLLEPACVWPHHQSFLIPFASVIECDVPAQTCAGHSSFASYFASTMGKHVAIGQRQTTVTGALFPRGGRYGGCSGADGHPGHLCSPSVALRPPEGRHGLDAFQRVELETTEYLIMCTK